MGIITKKLSIKGYVQGVGFRYRVKQKALSLNLRGYVKNLPEGSVEIVVEGEENQVKELVVWCKKGEFGSNIKEGEFKNAPAQKFFFFEIRY